MLPKAVTAVTSVDLNRLKHEFSFRVTQTPSYQTIAILYYGRAAGGGQRQKRKAANTAKQIA